jgi:hypothetical protein
MTCGRETRDTNKAVRERVKQWERQTIRQKGWTELWATMGFNSTSSSPDKKIQIMADIWK